MVTVNGGGTGGRSCAAFTMILVAVESMLESGEEAEGRVAGREAHARHEAAGRDAMACTGHPSSSSH
jgi:hypothetical protein